MYRLPNIKVSSVLLILFFLYDIFMVFISPLIFKSSVMVEVATAGGATSNPSVEPSGEQTCARTAEERIPMLFLVPRMDWRGGYGMLGLGDIVMPGLLLSFALRYDVLKRHSVKRMYFTRLMIGYMVGLFLAFLANYMQWTFNGVKGQVRLTTF